MCNYSVINLFLCKCNYYTIVAYCARANVCVRARVCTYVCIQSVAGGMCQTSGECSLS